MKQKRRQDSGTFEFKVGRGATIGIKMSAQTLLRLDKRCAECLSNLFFDFFWWRDASGCVPVRLGSLDCIQ